MTHPVARFFALAFLITWGLQLPGVLAQRGILPGDVNAYMPFVMLGIFGPLVAATLLTAREGGKPAVKALFKRFFIWRVHPGWYLLALFVPGALLTGLLFLLNLAGRTGPIGYFPVMGALVVGIVISIAEEVGWRGYAQPRLQERWGPFAAGSLIGVFWCFWHIPMFLGAHVPMSLLPLMMLLLVGGSLLLTFIYNNTGGSLLLAALAHLGSHLNNSNRALPDEVVPLVSHAIVYAALGLVVMWGSAMRGRGKGTLANEPVAQEENKGVSPHPPLMAKPVS